jgi:hypothetical protein
MADNNSNNQHTSSNNNISSAPSEPLNGSTWGTVNTSTTINVERLEIRKSDDYDKIIKKSK